jgi:VanZ family protein
VFVRYWLPVVLWMSVIFGFSTEAGAPRHTSRIIGPLLRWFNPEISDEAIREVKLVVRKTAHLTEYAILALLVWRARRQPVRGKRRPWRRADAFFAFAIAALFAVTDEWHQSFVPSREGKFLDVLIDSTGAALGLIACWSFGRWRKFW